MLSSMKWTFGNVFWSNLTLSDQVLRAGPDLEAVATS